MSNSIMFEAAVSKFVKSVGKESLIAVPNLDEANKCHPLQVVVKKNRRWFWQSAKFEPSPFFLNQLLTDESDFTDVKQTTRELTVYNKSHRFNMDGKIGAKLKLLVDAEISASDTIQVDAQFGQVNKVEADIPALMDQLSKRKLKLKHEFVEQVRGDWRKVLCVITGTAQVSADATVHMHVNWKGEEKVDVGSKAPIISEDEDADIGDEKDKKLTIPKDTPLAYNMCELYINSAGDIELMVDEDTQGGFETLPDETDGHIDQLMGRNVSLEEQFGMLVDLGDQEREDFRNAVLNVCAAPRNIPIILNLLRSMTEQTSYVPKPSNSDEENLLKTEDVNVIVNTAKLEDKDEKRLVDAVTSVFEALIELDDEETVALRSLNSSQAKAILYALHQTLEQEEISVKDKELSAIYAAPNPGQAFMELLGFKLSGGSCLVTTDDNGKELEGTYCAVYALWYDQKEADIEGRSWCTII